MNMPGRKYDNGSEYRYGFNGKENDKEVKGEGNQLDYGMRVLDPRLGRFLSVDPLQAKYAELTPYQFASNTPIQAIDLDGLERYYYKLAIDSKTGTTALSYTSTELREGTLLNALLGQKPSGDLITIKTIYVNVEVDGSENQTLNFSSFKDFIAWKNKGMSVDVETGKQQKKESDDMAQIVVVQFMFMTLEQQIDKTNGDTKPTTLTGKKSNSSPSENTKKQTIAANGNKEASVTTSTESAELQSYGGSGGGHHVPAKSAFTNAPGYNLNEALAIPNAELQRLGINHGTITGAQMKGYKALASSGQAITWESMSTIEVNALKAGGMSTQMANSTVTKAIEALKKAGVTKPTRIPWGGN